MAPHHYPDVISIHETFGAGLVGALVNAIMYGLTTLQTYLYYMYYPKDGRTNKLLVAIVWVIDTVHTVLVSMCIYFYLVSNYDNPEGLKAGHWTLFTSILCNVLISCLVQSFFLVRIYELAPPRAKWWLGGVLGFIVFAHLVFGILTVAYCFIKKDFSRLSEFTVCADLFGDVFRSDPSFKLFAATPFAITAVLADVLIAGSLCVLLHGSRTGFRSTDALVTTLIVYAVNRCLLTALMAIIEVIVFSLKSYALWYLAIDFVIGKLYANSFLATLNSRQALRSISGSNRSDTNYTDIEFESRPSGHVLDLRSRGSTANSKSTHSGSAGERSTHFQAETDTKIKADTPIEVFEATPTTKFS
ncbi:hypothetical protein FA13DRAFT_1789750 [Coprinellus micaceus]|uniref:DUF6534 domain-containing protein n=1 Tax=Coprinellus micaceus TaxID=71717 RepID=A0A4Y7TIF5_COPMI|nr:hypothetical protein FA13DRAFT_1789750 [Coprinellus micaceus]